MSWLYTILGHRKTIWLLLIVNLLGTIYGYIWYESQLRRTPAIFLPFVPDSPTASLFFVLVLIAFLFGKNWGLIEALALITLVKYGIWAVVMNFLVLFETGTLDLIAIMLVVSHGAMAIEGILYSPFYRIRLWHLVVASIWTLHNDVIDYVFYMLPSYPTLDQYIPQIGYFTFWLSIFSIGLAYFLTIRKKSSQLLLPFHL